MKYIFFSLLIFFFAVTASAQERAVKSSKQMNNYLPKAIKTDNLFPGKFKLRSPIIPLYQEELSQGWMGNEWANMTLSIQEFDTSSKKITVTMKNWGDGWVNTIKYTFNYSGSLADTSFRFVNSLFSMWGENGWNDVAYSEWLYDENNYLTEYRTSYLVAGMQILAQKETYENSSNGLPLVVTVQEADLETNILENTVRFTYSYNPANPFELVSETKADWDNGIWRDTSKIIYTRNTLLNVLSELNQDIYGGTTAENVSLKEFTYYTGDELVKTILDKSWNPGTSAWEISGRENYTYNSNGDEETYLYEYYYNGEYLPSARQTSEYDQSGLKLSHLGQIYENNGWVNYNRSLFNYVPTSVKDDKVIAEEFSLSQNYPNPFNPSTVISYKLIAPAKVSLRIYDALGKEVAELVNSQQNAGEYKVKFDAAGLASGIYYYTLSTPAASVSRKMLLMK